MLKLNNPPGDELFFIVAGIAVAVILLEGFK